MLNPIATKPGSRAPEAAERTLDAGGRWAAHHANHGTAPRLAGALHADVIAAAELRLLARRWAPGRHYGAGPHRIRLAVVDLGVAMQPFEAIVAEHGQVVMRVCRALLGPVEADDAWSETFLAALRAYPSLRPGSNVRGWLVTIAHNKAIDQIRARGRVPVPAGGTVSARLPAQEPGPGRGPEPVDSDLQTALAALPPKQRGAVVYRYLADLPYAEVAALLECSQAAARRSASDGIARLRRHYGKDLSDDV